MKIKVILFFFLITSAAYAQNFILLFHGNKTIDERTLYGVLDLYKPYPYEFYKEKPKLNSKIVPIALQTLQDFYKSQGFYHTKVTSLKKNNTIIINILENTPIKIQEIKIESLLSLGKLLPFKINDIFNAQKFIQSKKKIKLLYENHGYFNADFTIKAWIDIEKNSAKLLYKIKPNQICYFKNINIISSKNIDKDIVKSLLYINKGDIYSINNLDKSYKSLYAYGGISQAIIDTNIYNKTDVNATVKIKETQKPIRFQIGIGASSDEGPMASLGVKHRNFFGNLKTISLNAKATKIKQEIQLNYSVPLAHKNTFGTNLGFENENFFGFKENRVLAKGYFRQRDEVNFLQEAIIIDTSRSYDSNNINLFPEKTLVLVSPELEWMYNTRDKLLEPTKGYFVKTQLQGSLLSEISNATYYKAILTAGYILPLQTNILATKVQIGSLQTYEGDVPSSYRFFAGGMNSNRAYGYRRLGPTDSSNNPTGFNSIIETTVEYRFHIYGNFNGVAFNDNSFIGQTYIPRTTTGYYGVGFGLRYKTVIGPLAIDFGFDPAQPFKQHALHFHVGELF